jgi:hypothetical protein
MRLGQECVKHDECPQHLRVISTTARMSLHQLSQASGIEKAVGGQPASFAAQLGKGDSTAPGSRQLERRLGFPVAEIAVMVPAPWLRAAASLAGVPESAAPARNRRAAGEPAVIRIVCTGAEPGY